MLSEPVEGANSSMASNMSLLNHTGLDGMGWDWFSTGVPAFKTTKTKNELVICWRVLFYTYKMRTKISQSN